MSLQQPEHDMPALAAQVIQGDRHALAKSLTLIESLTQKDRQAANQLLAILTPHTGHEMRIAVTGAPGVGKSTFIDALGCLYSNRGCKVAVLAIDPSSEITGGSILGDKSRMPKLASHPSAFIRPSPSRGGRGGVAWRTREASMVCAAAGYEIIILETVGTGQTEVAARSITDYLILLLSPGSGDELQGIKRGIIESADANLINKADGELVNLAHATCTEYTAAHQLVAPATVDCETYIAICSAMKGQGIDEIVSRIEAFRIHTEKSDTFRQRRCEQAKEWFYSAVAEELSSRFFANPKVQCELQAAEESVRLGRKPPSCEAKDLLDRLNWI